MNCKRKKKTRLKNLPAKMCRWSTPLDFHFDACIIKIMKHESFVRNQHRHWFGVSWRRLALADRRRRRRRRLKIFLLFPSRFASTTSGGEISRRAPRLLFQWACRFFFLAVAGVESYKKKSSKSNALENSLINGARFCWCWLLARRIWIIGL